LNGFLEHASAHHRAIPSPQVEAAPFERFLEHDADSGQAAAAAAQHDKFSFARFLAFIHGEVRREVAQRPVTEE
jgi:hypothetical protein